MKFDKASSIELKNIFNKLMDNTSEPVFMVNKNSKIIKSNIAFSNFVQKTQLEIEGFDFGEVLGCSYLTKDTKACGNNYYCDLCSIRNAIDSSFNENKISEGDFVRDFELAKELIFRHIIFKSFLFEIEKETFVAIIINKSETDINIKDSESE